MAIIKFETGSNVRIRGTFRTPKDAVPPSALLDPSIVTLTIRRPDKTVEERIYGVGPEIVHPSTGIYESVLTLSQQGTYHWRWRGENGIEAGVITGELDSRLEPNF